MGMNYVEQLTASFVDELQKIGMAKQAQTHDLLPLMTPEHQSLVKQHAAHSLYKEPTSHTPKRRLLGLLEGKTPSHEELQRQADARVRGARHIEGHPELKTAALLSDRLKRLQARRDPDGIEAKEAAARPK